LQKLDEDGPNTYLIPFGIGEALQSLGRFEEAIEAYNISLSLQPDYADACLNMGNALTDQDKLKRQ